MYISFLVLVLVMSVIMLVYSVIVFYYYSSMFKLLVRALLCLICIALSSNSLRNITQSNEIVTLKIISSEKRNSKIKISK